MGFLSGRRPIRRGGAALSPEGDSFNWMSCKTFSLNSKCKQDMSWHIYHQMEKPQLLWRRSSDPSLRDRSSLSASLTDRSVFASSLRLFSLRLSLVSNGLCSRGSCVLLLFVMGVIKWRFCRICCSFISIHNHQALYFIDYYN